MLAMLPDQSQCTERFAKQTFCCLGLSRLVHTQHAPPDGKVSTTVQGPDDTAHAQYGQVCAVPSLVRTAQQPEEACPSPLIHTADSLTGWGLAIPGTPLSQALKTQAQEEGWQESQCLHRLEWGLTPPGGCPALISSSVATRMWYLLAGDLVWMARRWLFSRFHTTHPLCPPELSSVCHWNRNRSTGAELQAPLLHSLCGDGSSHSRSDAGPWQL